jgi:hypothetical protein
MSITKRVAPLKGWLDRLEGASTELLTPFTSETTRKEGTRLVLLSVIIILIARNVIVVTDGTFLGFKAQATKVDYLLAIAGVACAYLLVLYAFDLYRDWKAAYYKRLPSVEEVNRLIDTIVEERDANIKRLKYVSSEIDRLNDLRKQKLDELDLEHAPPFDPRAPHEEFNRQVKAELEWNTEWKKRMETYSIYCAGDGLAELEYERTQLVYDKTLIARTKALILMMKTSQRIDRVRFATEVLVPSGLALYALTLTGLHLLPK